MHVVLHNQLYSIIVITMCSLAFGKIHAQTLDIPRASPKASVSQHIGVCEVTISYCRPSARGRTIFGGLVPYDKVWRAGANEATTIQFSHDVLINNQSLAAGKYGLFFMPRADGDWTMILNKDWNQWGAYLYDPELDVLRTKTKRERLSESTGLLTYAFSNVTKSEATLQLQWSDCQISIPITTDTHLQTLSMIDQAVNDSRKNWYVYSAAAQYHWYEHRQADPALKYINVAIALEAPNPAPWMLKSQILASQSKYDKAIAVAREAILVCKNHNFPFEIHENENNIDLWKKQQ